MEKITPSNTKIVAGQPVNAGAAGAASVYHGSDSADPYGAMAKAYKELSNEKQFGGAMTWEINLDNSQGYKFANSIGPAVLP